MRSFITDIGKVIRLTATHDDYAKNILKSTLVKVLKDQARVHVHNRHLVVETSQTHLTVAQKRSIGKLYKEYNCVGWTVQINGRYSTSNIQDCENRIIWEQVKQI